MFQSRSWILNPATCIVWAAYDKTMAAAENAGCRHEAFERIRSLVAAETFGERFVTKILGHALGLK